MNKQEFKKIMQQIKSAYGDKFQELNNQVLDTWYKALEDLDISCLKKAVDKYIRQNKFPPTIAEIRDICHTIRDEKPEAADRFAVLPKELRKEYEEQGIIKGQVLDIFNASEEQIKYLQKNGIL